MAGIDGLRNSPNIASAMANMASSPSQNATQATSEAKESKLNDMARQPSSAEFKSTDSTTKANEINNAESAKFAKKKDPIDLNEVTGYNAANKNKSPRDINRLDNNAFMRLFLEQLKNQDPTSPMETDKIITQTAQLTQVEMQEQTKKTMIEVAEAMKSTKATNEELKNFQSEMKGTLEALVASLSGNSPKGVGDISSPYNSLNMIGKIVETKINGLNITDNKPISFELYFDEEIDSAKGTPKILIINDKNELVREVDISQMDGRSGYQAFTWDTKDGSGKAMPPGAYSIVANYNFKDNGDFNLARIGRGEVQSVIFNDGVPNLRVGELIVPLDDALEFYNRSGK